MKLKIQARTETISCKLCGCPDYSPYDKAEGWNIVSCKKCNFCYTNPRPIPEDLHLFYEEEYFKDERHFSKFYNEDGTPRAGHLANYRNRIEDVEEYVNQRGKIFELGAARGEFLKVLEERGWKVSGLEISADAVKMARELYNVHLDCGMIETYSPKETYDVVCMYQTLEHVPDALFVLKKSFEMLKPGGVFVAEVPNLHCFESKWNYKRKILSYDLPRHLNHFTPEILTKKAVETGFEKTHIKLFPDRIVREAIQFFRKPKDRINTLVTDKPGEIKAKPLAKTYKSTSTKIINTITEILPGWRFTIIAIKPK